jgi:hypothetical protein
MGPNETIQVLPLCVLCDAFAVAPLLPAEALAVFFPLAMNGRATEDLLAMLVEVAPATALEVPLLALLLLDLA